MPARGRQHHIEGRIAAIADDGQPFFAGEAPCGARTASAWALTASHSQPPFDFLDLISKVPGFIDSANRKSNVRAWPPVLLLLLAML
jgi:hypothetical protein